MIISHFNFSHNKKNNQSHRNNYKEKLYIQQTQQIYIKQDE